MVGSLVDILNKYVLKLVFMVVIVCLQDMVCNREAPLAGHALAVLEAVLSGQRRYEADLCASLRPALLQTLQKLSMEEMGHTFEQGNTTQGNTHKPIASQKPVPCDSGLVKWMTCTMEYAVIF